MIRATLVAVVFLGGLISTPSSVGAGGNSGFSTEYRHGWEKWETFGDTAIADPPTARIDGWVETPCLMPDYPGGEVGLGASGDEFDFSFGLFGDNCYSGSSIDGRPVAVFSWQYFDGAGLAVTFPCLDVRGSVSSGDIPGARIVFEPGVNFGVARANVSSDRLTDVTELEFALEIPFLEPEAMGIQGEVGPDDFLIDISIRPCSFDFDGPDIEHYRRMAEQVTALPDTL